MRVLLVEDYEGDRELTIRILEGAGHSVAWAATGERGFAQLAHERVDVIILDLGLPGMSGYEFAGRCRFDPDLRRIPIIILTGSSPEEISGHVHSVQNAISGASLVMGKPPDAKKLLRVLERLAAPKEDDPCPPV